MSTTEDNKSDKGTVASLDSNAGGLICPDELDCRPVYFNLLSENELMGSNYSPVYLHMGIHTFIRNGYG